MRGFFRWSSKWWPGVIPLAILWAVAAWTTTGPLEADLSEQRHRRAQGQRSRQDHDQRRRPRHYVLCRGVFGAGTQQRGGFGRSGAGCAAGQRSHRARRRSQTVCLDHRTRGRKGNARRQRAVAGGQEQAAGRRACNVCRHRHRRSHGFKARGAAAISKPQRHC